MYAGLNDSLERLYAGVAWFSVNLGLLVALACFFIHKPQFEIPKITMSEQPGLSAPLLGIAGHTTINEMTHSRFCRELFSCSAWAMFFAPSTPIEFSLKLSRLKKHKRGKTDDWLIGWLISIYVHHAPQYYCKSRDSSIHLLTFFRTDDEKMIPLSCLYSKYEATATSYCAYLTIKTWKLGKQQA